MKSLIAAIVLLAVPMVALAQGSSAETSVRQTVQAFYAAFNAHGFSHAAEFTTDDWNHINPYGGRTHGRAAVLKELHEVHVNLSPRSGRHEAVGQAACVSFFA